MLLVETKKLNKKEVNVVTSLDIAETFEKEHKNVLADIRNIQGQISRAEFSALFYEAGYKASNGKKNPMYYMNRDGFTLLVMGYNGEKAMKFKLGYIKQFNEMESLLNGKYMKRKIGIANRETFTKSIKNSRENERMHGHAYSVYTDLIYKAALNKTAKQLRNELGLSKQDSIRDNLTLEELGQVSAVEMITTGFINCGCGYDEVKNVLLNNPNIKLIKQKDIDLLEKGGNEE